MGRSFAREIQVQDLWSKFTSYFLVGGLSALADFGLYSLFVYTVGLHYLLAATLSFLLATGLNYILCIAFVFDSGNRSRHSELMLVYFVSVVGVTINLAVLVLAVELAQLHLLLAKIVGTGSAFAWNFSSRYFWIFRATEPTMDTPEPEDAMEDQIQDTRHD